MVQNSGTEATSVAMWAVTAISRPDGTAASAIQIAMSRQLGPVTAVVSVATASGNRLGDRNISPPQAATSAIRT
jgi:hypothetical protein